MKETENSEKEFFLEQSDKPLTITQLARLHLSDRNHKTNDDELRNAKIQLSNVISINENNRFAVTSYMILP
ncbi:MAG TPA: hypothetical protein VK369_09075 [Segetibacter sp.]|nr:hypothetical protein [Segetibacter sp.]